MSRTRTTPPKLELEVDLSLDHGELLDISMDGMDPDFLESGAIPPAPSVPTFELDVDLPSYDVDESSGVISWQVAEPANPRPTTPSGVRSDAVPILSISSANLATLPLDHRAGFIISLIDGTSTVEEILDISGMPAAEAREIRGAPRAARRDRAPLRATCPVGGT